MHRQERLGELACSKDDRLSLTDGIEGFQLVRGQPLVIFQSPEGGFGPSGAWVL